MQKKLLGSRKHLQNGFCIKQDHFLCLPVDNAGCTRMSSRLHSKYFLGERDGFLKLIVFFSYVFLSNQLSSMEDIETVFR